MKCGADMCGILLVHGENHQNLSQQLIQKLHHRGPDDRGFYHDNNLSIGFTRLAINDVTNGTQPHHHGDWVSVINGEIYNHAELKALYHINDSTQCDTHIIASLFEKFNADILQMLDGFYSGILYNKKTNQLFIIRDYIGKKPLFLIESTGYKIITSELKSVAKIDNFKIIPKGCCTIDLHTSKITILQHHKLAPMPQKSLKQLLYDAVAKRIPPDKISYGAFLSGGLDSSIMARILMDLKTPAKFYLLTDTKNNKDYYYGKIVLDTLNINNYEIVALPNADEIEQLITELIMITESYNPAVISNGLCTYLLARAAKRDNLKVIISGDGADEMFGGYFSFKHSDDWQESAKKILDDMCFTELRRIDLTTMHHSIEVRCPFLDRNINAFRHSLSYNDCYHDDGDKIINKYILRKSFQDLLPDEIIWRQKTSFDVGSGIRKMVVSYLTQKYGDEKTGLKQIWNGIFHHSFAEHPYFHSSPSFDDLIKKRGFEHQK